MKKMNFLQSYLTRLRGLMLTLIILCSIGVRNVYGVDYTLMLTLDLAGASDGTMTEITTDDGIKSFLQSAAPASTDIKSASKDGGKIYDAKGSGGTGVPDKVLKIGTASGDGSFSFTIADTYDNVSKVDLIGYGWKTTTAISVNSSATQSPDTKLVNDTFTYVLGTATKTISVAVTTSAFCATTIKLYKTAAPASKYTVSFSTGTGNPSVDALPEASAGAGITLPSVTPACSSDGWALYGWATAAVGSSTTTAPSIVGKAGETYNPTSNTTLYAVYAKGEYTKETSSITSGSKYLIVGNTGGHNYIMKSSSDDFKDYSGYKGMDAAQIDETSTGKYHAAAVYPQWCYTIEGTAGNYYIRDVVNSSSSNYADIAYGNWWGHSQDSDDKYTITVSSGIWTVKNNYYNSGYSYLGLDASDLAFFSFNSAKDILLYKAGTINYWSAPTCAACDANPTIGDASLNGSFNMTSTTSAIGVASGTCAAGTSCSWADYGFVWSDGTDTKTPTVSNNKVQVGTSGTATSWTGSVTPSGSTSPTSWTTGHTYYVCTYGKNNKTGAAFTYGSTWSFTPQSVTFKANGGTGDDKVQYLRKSTSTALTSNTFTKVGHDFAGWATSSGGSVVYTDGASVNIDADLTLHAKWSPKDYTITTTLSNCSWSSAISSPYTYDGATNSITRTVNPSSGYGCPSTITVTMGGSTLTVSTDYTWSVTNGVGSFTLKKAITGNVAITITAQPMVKWMAGGEIFNTQIGTAGTALTSPGTPSNSTYCDGVKVFVGWSASTISGISNTAPSDLFLSVAGKTITAGATYYAVFADKESTDTYKKIESTEDFTGGYYVFATPENAMTNTVTSKVAGSTPVSISSDAISTPGATIIWFVEKSTISSTDYYTLYNANANKFMNIIADGSYGQLSLQTTPATYTAGFDNTNKDIALYSVSRSGQLIEYYNGFKSYNSKGNALIYAYKRKLSNYATTCCDKIVTLSAGSPSNGTVEFTQSSSSVTSVATCSGAQDVTMTIDPDNGYKLTSFTVATGDGKVPADKITTDPAVGTSSNSSAAQEIGLTFAQNASGAYNVTVGFSEMVVTNWSWTNHDGGAALTTDPIEIYVDQQARVDVTYTPAKAQLLSSHTASTYYSHDAAGSAYVKNANKASEYFTFKGKAEGTTTITLTHNDDTSSPKAFQQLIYVKVLPLPLVHFVDNIQNQSFDDVVEEIVDNELSGTKTAPTHSDVSDPGSNYNTCERNHVHLIGWIRSDWAEEHPGAKDSQITGAGNDAFGNAYYYAAGASLDVEAQNGKTFYAVWSKIE